MPPERSVRITALGVVSPLGVGVRAATWPRLLSGEAPPLVRSRGREGVPLPELACLFEPPFEIEKHAPELAQRVARASLLSQLALLAARECLADARFPEADDERRATGVVLATCFGSSQYHLDYHEALRRRGLRGASPLLFSESVWNAASGHVSHVHRLRGPSLTLVGGEEAGLSAIATAFDRIALGAIAVLAGGVEQHTDLVHASCARAGLVGNGAFLPHGSEPAPFAEGAALVLLEEASAAARRRAEALAFVLGVGRARRGREKNDEPATRPLVRAAESACREARIAPGEIDLIVGGACGGRIAARELAALGEFLGERESPCFLSLPKGAVGEGFAFTSALQVVAAALALSEQVVPATPGARESRLPHSLRCVSEPARRELRHALVLASSDPGSAVALVLARAPRDGHAR